MARISLLTMRLHDFKFFDLNSMKIILVNDVRIRVPRLILFEHNSRKFSDDVWMVEPESEQSGQIAS